MKLISTIFMFLMLGVPALVCANDLTLHFNNNSTASDEVGFDAEVEHVGSNYSGRCLCKVNGRITETCGRVVEKGKQDATIVLFTSGTNHWCTFRLSIYLQMVTPAGSYTKKYGQYKINIPGDRSGSLEITPEKEGARLKNYSGGGGQGSWDRVFELSGE